MTTHAAQILGHGFSNHLEDGLYYRSALSVCFPQFRQIDAVTAVAADRKTVPAQTDDVFGLACQPADREITVSFRPAGSTAPEYKQGEGS